MIASLHCKVGPSTSANTITSVQATLCTSNSTICEGIISVRRRKSHIAADLDVSTPGRHDTPAELGNEGQKAELWVNDTSTNAGATSPKDLAHEGDATLPRDQNEIREICEMP